MKIKNKLLNHITLSGKKETSEKNLLKSLKELQKNSLKKFNNIIQLALIFTIPVFKLHVIKNKKRKKSKTNKNREIPGFIKNKNSRISLAIKFILQNTKSNNKTFYKKLYKEILLDAGNKGNSVKIKTDLQKNILTKKHYFRYYRWS